MAVPGENIQVWSVTAVNNANSDTAIDWQEGQPRASVNNSARSMMAAHAKDRNLRNGSIVTSGVPNAQLFTSGVTFDAVPTGLRVLLKIGAGLSNTGEVTLNMDGIGTAPVKNLYGNALGGGELIENIFYDFLYDGTNWLLLQASLRINVQVFAASALYTPSPGTIYAIMEAVAGGGGGGGAVGDPFAPLTTFNGGGGGSGGYSRSFASATAIGASLAVIIGAAGGAGSAGGNGSAGGITAIGTLCSANGGQGGSGGTPSQLGSGGAGGTAGTGNVIASFGSPGGPGLFAGTANVNIQAPSGNGAPSFFGGGGQGVQNSGGNGANSYGAGGGGAGAFNTGSPFSGGSGGSGLAIITEFRT